MQLLESSTSRQKEFILFLLLFQLRECGFRHIDALDPSEDMLSVAKKENLYDNYICEFLTDKKLPIAPGNIKHEPMFNLVCALIEDSDQPARSRGKDRSDSADVQTEPSLYSHVKLDFMQ